MSEIYFKDQFTQKQLAAIEKVKQAAAAGLVQYTYSYRPRPYEEFPEPMEQITTQVTAYVVTVEGCIGVITSYNICTLHLVELSGDTIKFIRMAGCNSNYPYFKNLQFYSQFDCEEWNREWNKLDLEHGVSTIAAIYVEADNNGVKPLSLEEAVRNYNFQNILEKDEVIFMIEGVQ